MLEYFDFPIINTLWVLLLLSWGIVNIFWCLQMQQALHLISPNEKMPPQNVWLVYIPLFGFVWQFIVVTAVADSLGEEYHRRGIIPREPRPGFSSGLSASILLTCALIPAFGIAIALCSNIPRIVHLNKVKNYCRDLQTIMQVQQNYPPQVSQIPLEDFAIPEKSVDEVLQKNNPERFMPPRTPEQDYERWRKK